MDLDFNEGNLNQQLIVGKCSIVTDKPISKHLLAHFRNKITEVVYLIKENDNLPNSEIFVLQDGEPVKKNIEDFFKDKKVIIFGLPGAYTSVCSAKHLPGYIKMHDQYKEKGIDHIICISVNDPFVMNAWGKQNDVGEKIVMMGDPFLNFTKEIGADVDKSGRGLGIRSNRYTMFVDNMKVIKLQEEADTGSCEISAAENFFKLI